MILLGWRPFRHRTHARQELADVVSVALGIPEVVLGHRLRDQSVLMRHIGRPIERPERLPLVSLVAGLLIEESANRSVAARVAAHLVHVLLCLLGDSVRSPALSVLHRLLLNPAVVF